MLDTLVTTKNVGGVVCCAEEWELKAAGSCGMVQRQDWDAAGVRVHRVPFEKHFLAVEEDVHGAMQFIDDVTDTGKSVYIHSIDGRTRAPTIAACYYLYKKGGKGDEALGRISIKRKKMKYAYNHWRTIDNYGRYLEKIKGTPAGMAQEVSEKSVLQRLVGYVWS
ncbi:Protein F28C6.8 a [Aphelenchoides avenae]|nr:Protein F28C6.8 a [Aphelenchus avenae]